MSDTGKKGHRQRLRDRFAGREECSRSEEALLELLLTYATPRKDVQPLAAGLVSEYGSLSSLLEAPMEALCQSDGVKGNSAVLIKLVDWIRRHHGPKRPAEEKAKREARVKGLGRRVKRYIAQLEQGAVIPDHERPNDATLAEWIRHCKRAGLYEQGKLLYEKGGLNPDNLSEEAMVNVEEDYQVCARILAREATAPERSGRKKGAA